MCEIINHLPWNGGWLLYCKRKRETDPFGQYATQMFSRAQYLFSPAFDLKKGKLKRQWKGSGFLETTRPILSHLEQPFPFPIAQAASFQEACSHSPTKAVEAFGGQTLASISHETCYLERRRKACVQPASCRHGLNLTRLDVSQPCWVSHWLLHSLLVNQHEGELSHSYVRWK